MDYSQYFVVPKAAAATVAKLFEERRIIDDGKFLIVISDDHKAADKLDIVLDFHNDEWSAWGFLLLAKGKQVAQGIFGENAESGISLEDNCLEGDLDKAATLLGCDAKKLRTVVEGDEPDVEKFIKVVGFGRYSITPYELDRATRGEKQELFDPPRPKKTAAKKTTTKPAAKTTKKKPAAKQPAAKQPAAKKPAAKQPAAKKPAAKQPAAKQPAAKKPAAKQPAAKKPAAKR